MRRFEIGVETIPDLPGTTLVTVEAREDFGTAATI